MKAITLMKLIEIERNKEFKFEYLSGLYFKFITFCLILNSN